MARKRKVSCSEQLDATLRLVNAYEKERCITIENNTRQLEELGPSKSADQLRMKTPNEIKGKEKLNRNDKDQDYMPTEDCEDDEGPTMLFDVYARKWEDRVAILFNEKNQHIRTTDDDVSEFSKFLGTIAYDHTLPPSAEKWMMQSIRDSWRAFKCRIKKDHNFKYDNDADRWKHYPNREISGKNFENREQQQNMQTMVKPPSKRKMFEETRARKEGRTYKQPNGDTLDKIKRIKELESLKELGLDSDSDIDPFNKVTRKKEHHGQLRLCGRGSSPFVAPQLVDAIKSFLTADMQNDLTAHKEKLENEYNARQKKMEGDLQADKEKLNQALEVECAKVVDMQKELEAQKAKLDDVIPKALAQLQKLVPRITLEMMAQAFALFDNDRAFLTFLFKVLLFMDGT
ncbi:hypothetical protein Cgig2_021002 [Carnegiea gigantea]|uniref:Transposase, Ptta/En/Spm, plant n=1 Tax=Carnegiea gigantea TaxID=171969 RepID=A0A9Q1KB36_9CARY|nr:hypothetical protein Cgig2_021002 [Carnegiea gigantea]